MSAAVANASGRRTNASGLETRRHCYRRRQRQSQRRARTRIAGGQSWRAFCRQSSNSRRGKNRRKRRARGFVCQHRLRHDPDEKDKPGRAEKSEQFWRGIGSRVLRLTPEIHDSLVSRSSHLPHIIAATLASHVLNPAHPKHQAALCANGFRDTTRIASGSPEMWRDIALANRKNLAKSLDAFIADLQKFRRVLKKGDAKAMTRFFETAKKRRDNWCAGCASPSPE